MSEFFQRLFSDGEFMPHGHCYFWKPGLLWLHIVSDALIALAYYSIPLTLLFFIYRRRDMPFPLLILMFGAFIIACGTTHIMEIWSIWHGTYWISGVIKAITALLSVGTAIVLVKLIPQTLQLRSPAAFAEVNASLEARVSERTGELTRANAALQNEIAERKRAEEALRESEQRLSLITNLVPHGIFAKDAAGRYIFANLALAERYGFPLEEIRGKTDFDMVSDTAQAEAYREDDLAVMKSGKAKFISEEPNTNRAGDIRFFQTTKIPFTVPETGEPAVLGVWVDITERKEAEQELRESEARKSSILEAALDCIITMDERGRIVEFNPAAEKVFGFHKSDVIGAELAETIIPAEYRDAHRRGMAHYLRTSEGPVLGKRVELTGQRADGSIFPLELAVTAISFGGKQIFTAHLRDITERKQAEQLMKAQLAEKQTLLQEIHHRVKNNLQVISSLLSFQQQQATEPGIAAQFQQSRNRVEAIALVHERLYQSENLHEINFASYVRELTDYIMQSFGADAAKVQLTVTGSGFSVNVEKAVPCALILNELVSNSMKHAFPGGRRGAIRIELGEEATAGLLTIRVSDDGVGLPPYASRGNVHSLGLRLIHRLADQLQGKVETLNPPEGAAFQLTFPQKS